MLTRLKALRLLSECVGDEIWSAELCQEKGIPEAWVEELADCFESGYKSDQQTIYHDSQMVNQYHGVRDVDLACKLAEYLGVHPEQVSSHALGMRSKVRALKEAVEEL
jgi:DNA-binding transcriptional ArsR family regulator